MGCLLKIEAVLFVIRYGLAEYVSFYAGVVVHKELSVVIKIQLTFPCKIDLFPRKTKGVISFPQKNIFEISLEFDRKHIL